MSLPSRISFRLCVLVAVLGLGSGVLVGMATRDASSPTTGDTSPAERVGGDFTLIGPHDRPLGLAAMRGQVVTLFFGYTHCPDICPSVLHTLKALRNALGDDGRRLQVVMVTVDPERDTSERLARYLGYFDSSFVGLTASTDVIDEVLERYGAAYRRGAPDGQGSYTVDHTSLMYLIDGNGRVRHLLASTSSVEQMMPLTRELLAELETVR